MERKPATSDQGLDRHVVSGEQRIEMIRRSCGYHIRLMVSDGAGRVSIRTLTRRNPRRSGSRETIVREASQAGRSRIDHDRSSGNPSLEERFARRHPIRTENPMTRRSGSRLSARSSPSDNCPSSSFGRCSLVSPQLPCYRGRTRRWSLPFAITITCGMLLAPLWHSGFSNLPVGGATVPAKASP